MGRRKKAAKKVVKKKRPIVSKTFKCLFCSQDQAVVCKMDKFKSRTGHLQCTACDAEFTSSRVNNLSEPIDIYHEWLDKLAAAQGEESRKFLDEHPVDQNAFDDADDGAQVDDQDDDDDE